MDGARPPVGIVQESFFRRPPDARLPTSSRPGFSYTPRQLRGWFHPTFGATGPSPFLSPSALLRGDCLDESVPTYANRVSKRAWPSTPSATSAGRHYEQRTAEATIIARVEEPDSAFYGLLRRTN